MGCKCGSKGLTEEQKKILKAMAEMGECASKDIAEATGIPGKSVSCRLTSLKKKGYIESPKRCRYVITDTGREQI
jgi:predicted transcriptional regulator